MSHNKLQYFYTVFNNEKKTYAWIDAKAQQTPFQKTTARINNKA
jgi:hypothetical protein